MVMKRGRDGVSDRITDVEMRGVIHETDRAVLFGTLDGKQVWLPKSQIEYQFDPTTHTWSVTLPEGLAIEKGLV